MDKITCPKCGGGTMKHGSTPSGKQRHTCKICKHRTTQPLINTDVPTLDPAITKERLAGIRELKKTTKVQRYVITSAQNNTKVHKGFLASLLNYCEHNNAELIVIPVRYKNPTGWADRHSEDDIWYPKEVIKYLVDRDVILNKNVAVMASVKIQATAVDPVTGLETISGTRSAIFGHAQLRMKTVATPQDKMPKILHTTGSVSQKNYSDTKAGAKGKHHHSHSALIIEIKGDKFFPRQLCAGDHGHFYDLDKFYTGDDVIEGSMFDALVGGDDHDLFMDPKVRAATYDNEDSIVNVMRPGTIVRHDVLDFYTQNHHHKNNPALQFVKATTGHNDVRAELDAVLKMIDETTPDYAETWIVSSNHNAALMRWLNEYRADRDPFNALIYHELCAAVYGKAHWRDGGAYIPNPLKLYAEGKLKCKYKFLSDRVSNLIKGIDVGQHGDKGANGARGAINSFAQSEYKMIVGHSHSPGIKFGAWQVGTSTYLQLGYNSGLSSWLQTHAGIYPNGKRVLITVIDGEWRA